MSHPHGRLGEQAEKQGKQRRYDQKGNHVVHDLQPEHRQSEPPAGFRPQPAQHCTGDERDEEQKSGGHDRGE